VDYAFEPNAMEKLYQVVEKLKHNKVIHVLGSTGGGRDVSRRGELGKIAGEKADKVIVTNEDPYDEDPEIIIAQVASGVEYRGKKEGKNLYKIIDRREAISKALHLAGKNDIVLITGKGCEQAICEAKGRKTKWDDREVAREELNRLLN
jgi:UDP-N-acetylmuramyl tripeptide synthase